MAHYLLYWRPDTVRNMRSDTLLYYAGSDQFTRMHVAPGDVLWGVTSFEPGDLRLVGRIQVSEVTTSRERASKLARGGWLWEHAGEFVFGTPETSRPKQDLDISEAATTLTFERNAERLPENFSGQHLQSMRRLTDASAGLLEQQWSDSPSGHSTRNPPWQRDELILALDLYFRLGQTVADDTNSDVIAVSELLNKLPIHPVRPDADRFRNPNGVALKLANFRAVDQPGRGMARGNRLDRVLWEEFAGNPQRLRNVAETIRIGVTTEARRLDVAVVSEPDEEEFPEGRIIYRLHRARERNRALIERKKAQVLALHGRLACEVCGFDFAAVYGPLGDGYIECHHAVALHESPEDRKSRLEDVVLVCANCHRMIHRKRPWLTVASVKTLLVRQD
jgi:5-methylcytosine-specific restriction enzyme A